MGGCLVLCPHRIQQAPSGVPRVIDDLFCGEVTTTTSTSSSGVTHTSSSESDANHNHILRCDYDITRGTDSSAPDHGEDFAVECSELCGGCGGNQNHCAQ